MSRRWILLAAVAACTALALAGYASTRDLDRSQGRSGREASVHWPIGGGLLRLAVRDGDPWVCLHIDAESIPGSALTGRVRPAVEEACASQFGTPAGGAYPLATIGLPGYSVHVRSTEKCRPAHGYQASACGGGPELRLDHPAEK